MCGILSAGVLAVREAPVRLSTLTALFSSVSCLTGTASSYRVTTFGSYFNAVATLAFPLDYIAVKAGGTVLATVALQVENELIIHMKSPKICVVLYYTSVWLLSHFLQIFGISIFHGLFRFPVQVIFDLIQGISPSQASILN